MSIGVVAASYVATPPATGYAAAVLALSPLGYWRLNETGSTAMAQDSSGNARHFTTSLGTEAACTRGAAGLTSESGNTAWSWANTASYGQRQAYAAWMNSASFSVTFVANVAAGAGMKSVLTRRGTSYGTDDVFGIRFNSGKLEALLWTATGLRDMLSASDYSGARHHFAVTYDATTGDTAMYVDGVSVFTNDGAPAAMTSTTSVMDLGAWGGSPNETFVGVLDEVAFHGAALTGAQVATLSAASSSVNHRAAASTPFNGTDASSQVVTIPSTVQVGDVMILGAVSNSAGPPSTPAGWTAIDTWTGSFSHHKLLYRLAQAGDAGSTVTVTLGSPGRLSLGMSCYSGAQAPSGYARTVETSGATVTHPSVTAVSPYARLVCGMSLYTTSVSATETVGSPLTSRVAQTCVWTHVAIGDQQLAAAGATGTRTSSIAQTGTEFAWSLLLEPA